MNQKEALDILKTGANVYLTGSAGSGKTHTLNQYIDYLKERDIEVAITASTGIAATHMGGVTIHSWSGIGIKDRLTPYDLDKLEQKKQLWDKFQRTQVLIIDEISMLDAERLNMVDQVSKMFKRDERPFGGMQVILSGDFFQLPPVVRGDKQVVYAFESQSWKQGNIVTCYLSTQYRQDDDIYLGILNEIRANDVTEYSMDHFRLRYKKEPKGEVEPTKLYTHNIDVDRINAQKLKSIDGEEYSYEVTTRGKKHLVEGLIKSCLAPEKLILKEGAVVMFVKNNYEAGYVNGTMGVVIGFEDRDGEDMPIVQISSGESFCPSYETWSIEEEGKVLAEICQLPLRLAWAITVHKSQGMSLDAAEIDLSKSFVAGQGYVALSRVRTLDGLKLMGLNRTALQIDPKILEHDALLKEASELLRSDFETLSAGEVGALHKDFIRRSGGSLTPNRKSKAKKGQSKKRSTYELTKDFVDDKLSIQEIALKRGLSEKTILGHLEKLSEQGQSLSIDYLLDDDTNLDEIKKAFKESGDRKLKPVYELLDEKYSYDQLRIARLILKL